MRDQPETVLRNKATDSHRTVDRIHYLPVRINHETACVEVSLFAFVEGARFKGYLFCIKTVCNGEGDLKFLSRFAGMFESIRRSCYQSYVHSSELVRSASKVNQLLTAHRSPVAAVDQQNAPAFAQILRNYHTFTAHQSEVEVGKAVSCIQQCGYFPCHAPPPDMIRPSNPLC